MEDNKYTWIPIYQELANTLLQYKDNRKPLVDWIYNNLSSILNNKGKPLINYLHEKDGSRINDIDPFSVYAIFNRGISNTNRSEILKKFKECFKLQSDIPSDYDGIPIVNPMRSFFFSWENDNKERIENLWKLFYKVLRGEDFSTEYNIAAKASGIKYNITMWLYWLRPYNYLAFDERNRNGLKSMGLDIKESDVKDCSRYLKLINNIKEMMETGTLPFKSFPELSFTVWNHDINGMPIPQSKRVWCWNCMGDPYESFKHDYIGMGDSVKEIKDYSVFKTKDELGQEYRKIHGNADVSVPDAYWKFMKEVSEGDIVVVTTNKMQNDKNTHLLYGWGIFSSDFYSVVDDDDHLRRDVKWHKPYLNNPILDEELRNSLFFHSTTASQASNIIKLLNINLNKDKEMDRIQPYIELLKANYNVILTGAPGTGKTYLAKQIAATMIGCKTEELASTGHYGFVQFHPSYDYTDFVEGLRPKKSDRNSDSIGFERKDGVFKTFCKRALHSQETGDKIADELNDNPTVWKVSLAGTGENEIRTDCMKNGHIRIGWSEYGDVDFNDFSNYTNGGSVILKAFQNTMKTGDIVVSCYSEKTIDAIGIITGDYFYNKDGGEYPRYRDVKWLVKGINENIVSLNGGKKFTLSTIYKSNISSTDALNIVKKYVSDKPDEKPFVFVIDEINRGEISKIFGELFFSIDPGYRGIEGRVDTQYQNIIDPDDAFAKGFFIPDNVYIIGTMNDIDRSVESIDFAMRRRFAWEEVTAKKSMDNILTQDNLKGVDRDTINELRNRMQNLNDAIIGKFRKDDNVSRSMHLGTAYQIGGSYFLKFGEYYKYGKEEAFNKLWNNHIKNVVSEYLRGNTNYNEQLAYLEKAYNDGTAHDNDNAGDTGNA